MLKLAGIQIMSGKVGEFTGLFVTLLVFCHGYQDPILVPALVNYVLDHT